MVRSSFFRILLIVSSASAAMPASARVTAVHEPTQDPMLRSLIDAERGFARRAQDTTVHQAFLENLADGGLLFRPGPVDGKKWLADHPIPADLLLDWTPGFADVSTSDDLGYTTGPWRAGPRGGEPTTRGHFITVWSRNSTRVWKAVLDVGISVPGAVPWPEQVDTQPVIRPGRMVGNQLSLEAKDRALRGVLARLGAAGYRTFLDPGIRLFRNGNAPARGIDAALELAKSDVRTSVETPAKASVSRSGDLAYTYGSFEGQDGDRRVTGHFVRIWKFSSGDWRLVLDIRLPTPPPG
jgi:hypothetical protein